MRTWLHLGMATAMALGVTACGDQTELPSAPEPSLQKRGGHERLFSHFSSGGPAAGLALLAEGLSSPVTLKESPDGTGRLFIVDQIGQVRVLLADGTLLGDPYLDVTDRMVPLMDNFDERGLLGLAFHPDFASNGRFFVYYSAPLRPGAPAGYNHTARISEFTAAPGANVVDPATEQIILEVDQPQFNHNGGTLEFGPADGYLYISLGDGGGANDVGLGHVEDWYDVNAGGNGQDVEANLLGNILRIDVSSPGSYTVPPDNPFVGTAGLGEIWAYGLRNPYRMSFDMAAPHVLLAGDAGQGLAEEVSLIVRGGNYGWNVKEGRYCFNAEDNLNPLDTCPDVVGAGHPAAGEPLLSPVIAYPNQANPFVQGLGVTVIGGYVYRGEMLPQFRGRYIFADFSRTSAQPAGRIFIANPRVGRPGQAFSDLWSFQELHFPRRPGGEVGHFVKGFGQDLNGEVYVLGTLVLGPSGNTGKVFLVTRVSGLARR